MSLSLKAASAEFYAGEKGRRRKRRELSEEQKQEIVEAFNLFDTDKDQAVDYHELKVKCINMEWGMCNKDQCVIFIQCGLLICRPFTYSMF